MPLTMIRTGESGKIRRISGKDESRRFLNNLGFVEGETVTVVSYLAGNMILNVKDTRVALDKSMAKRIIV
ncbi:ferrous iron transport protein A [Anaerovorax odorimutans]|uniref:Ferrous iron transport protein A n=1 Tax=Anaerovorax odorimutans TaxID=109327 RepID=A0ABT1RRZ7_9FIRM|nr:FeoA family protein [Anaerovorax odorimutans]MCQ4637978.1 ferrous iron transport protein A [Anaerovorax odorimutans]